MLTIAFSLAFTLVGASQALASDHAIDLGSVASDAKLQVHSRDGNSRAAFETASGHRILVERNGQRLVVTHLADPVLSLLEINAWNRDHRFSLIEDRNELLVLRGELWAESNRAAAAQLRHYADELDELAGILEAPDETPQLCGFRHDELFFGGLSTGASVALAPHRKVSGSYNWNRAMDAFVGKNAVVTELVGVDAQGCPVARVDTDGGKWLWRVRDLKMKAVVPERPQAERPHAQRPQPKVEATPLVPEPTPVFPVVQLYSADWCGVCDIAETFLKSEGIRYRRIEVEADGELDTSAQMDMVREILSRGGRKEEIRGYPILIVGDEVMHGFSEEMLRSLLPIQS